MKKNDKTLTEMIIVGVILIFLIGGFSFVAIKTKFDEKRSSRKVETKEEIKEPDNNVDIPVVQPEIKNDTSESTSSLETKPVETTIKSETDLLNHVRTLNSNLDIENDQNNPTFKEKAKNTFTTIVDFLFYDKEIKGYKFKDLTLKTKLEILKLAATIDNKIDKYFPDYKDSIKTGYENIKGKIAVLYLETTSKFCASVDESVCKEARDNFNTMKTSFGYTFDLIKELASSAGTKLVTILEEWYKSIK